MREPGRGTELGSLRWTCTHGMGSTIPCWLAPPRSIALKDDEAELLNANLTQSVRQTPMSSRYTEGRVLVQPVAACPWPSCLMVGCGRGPRALLFAERLPSFLGHVQDKASFEIELENNIRSSALRTTSLHHTLTTFHSCEISRRLVKRL